MCYGNSPVVNAPGADTETKVSPTLQIDIPVLSFGTKKYKAQFDYHGQEATKYLFSLTTLTLIPDTEVKGKVLYEKSCAICHTIGGSSSTKSVDYREIIGAIVTNTGGMGALNLTDPELKEIAAYLNSITSTPTPVTTVQIGHDLYDKNCVACHAINSSAFLASKNGSSIYSAILKIWAVWED